MRTDITQGRSAEQRVAQGMDQHVAIRMRSESCFVWNGHAAEHERALQLETQNRILIKLAQRTLAEGQTAREKLAELNLPPAKELDDKVVAYVNRYGKKRVQKALAVKGKHERGAAMKESRNELIEKMLAKETDDTSLERLEALDEELANLREEADSMRGHWQMEKDKIVAIQEIKERAEQLRAEAEEAEAEKEEAAAVSRNSYQDAIRAMIQPNRNKKDDSESGED